MTENSKRGEKFWAHAALEYGRASGRTFRMILSAVLACSGMDKNHPRTVYIIGHSSNHCRDMHRTAEMILRTIQGCSFEREEICMPNGSRVMFRAAGWYEKHARYVESQVKNNGDMIYTDHYVTERLYGKR